MGIVAWLILGDFSGWIASIIMDKNASMGAIANIVTGIIGAFIGGVVFNLFGAQKVGACILLWILNKISKK